LTTAIGFSPTTAIGFSPAANRVSPRSASARRALGERAAWKCPARPGRRRRGPQARYSRPRYIDSIPPDEDELGPAKRTIAAADSATDFEEGKLRRAGYTDADESLAWLLLGGNDDPRVGGPVGLAQDLEPDTHETVEGLARESAATLAISAAARRRTGLLR
jgi:hypothetical protein